MNPYNQDDDNEDQDKQSQPSDNTGFFSGLIKANNDAYQKRKQAQDDSVAIARDKFDMSMNPNAVGPRQDPSILAQPLPAERQNLEENVLPAVTSGSLGVGPTFGQASKNIGNMASMPGSTASVAKLKALEQLAKDPNTASMSVYKQIMSLKDLIARRGY